MAALSPRLSPRILALFIVAAAAVFHTATAAKGPLDCTVSWAAAVTTSTKVRPDLAPGPLATREVARLLAICLGLAVWRHPHTLLPPFGARARAPDSVAIWAPPPLRGAQPVLDPLIFVVRPSLRTQDMVTMKFCWDGNSTTSDIAGAFGVQVCTCARARASWGDAR